jgi:hypothetical protein
MGTLSLQLEINKEHRYCTVMIYLYADVQYGLTNIEGKDAER